MDVVTRESGEVSRILASPPLEVVQNTHLTARAIMGPTLAVEMEQLVYPRLRRGRLSLTTEVPAVEAGTSIRLRLEGFDALGNIAAGQRVGLFSPDGPGWLTDVDGNGVTHIHLDEEGVAELSFVGSIYVTEPTATAIKARLDTFGEQVDAHLVVATYPRPFPTLALEKESLAADPPTWRIRAAFYHPPMEIPSYFPPQLIRFVIAPAGTDVSIVGSASPTEAQAWTDEAGLTAVQVTASSGPFTVVAWIEYEGEAVTAVMSVEPP